MKKEKKKTEKKKSNNLGNSEKLKTEKILIENFVALQHVMTNLAVRFDNLSGEISKLLELFEIAAKTLAEKGPVPIVDDKTNIRLSEKLDSLLEQNKIIAKGITLLHEKTSEQPQEMQRSYQPPSNRVVEVGGYPQSQDNNPRFSRLNS